MADEKFVIVQCGCRTPEHQFRLYMYPATKNDGPDLYMAVQLHTHEAWHVRLLRAFKYVFKIKEEHLGHWDETLILRDQAEAMKKFLDEYLAMDYEFRHKDTSSSTTETKQNGS